jgi:hypothetical protein
MKPTIGIAGCCARDASGHANADPAIPATKARRRIAFREAKTMPTSACACADYSREMRPAK